MSARPHRLLIGETKFRLQHHDERRHSLRPHIPWPSYSTVSPGGYEGEMVDGDGSLWDGSDEEFDKAADLDSEWQTRRNQFHTIGYGDGLLEGKEAFAQEGFNMGFKESFHAGHSWRLVRGVPDALKLFHDDIAVKKAVEHSEHGEASSNVTALQDQSSDCSHLEDHFGELQSLLVKNPAIQVHLEVQK